MEKFEGFKNLYKERGQEELMRAEEMMEEKAGEEIDKRLKEHPEKSREEITHELMKEFAEGEKIREKIIEFASSVKNLDKILFLSADTIERMERTKYPIVKEEGTEIKESKKPSDYKEKLGAEPKTIILMAVDESRDKELVMTEVEGKGEKKEWTYPIDKVLHDIQEEVAGFVKQQGFKATNAYYMPLKSALIQSGLGVRGKNTLVYFPEFGFNLRWTAIVTDLQTLPDDGIIKESERLCENCDICIKACPNGAIQPYQVDKLKCRLQPLYDYKGTQIPYEEGHKQEMCSICYNVCPKRKG